jgi:hypothetical protein
MNNTYNAGSSTAQDTLLADAKVLFESSTAELISVVGVVMNKAEGAPIYKLPPEIMCMIFSFLDTDSLFICQSTCQKWMMLLESRAVWNSAQAVLDGKWKEIEAKWTRLQKKVSRPSSIALNIISERFCDEDNEFNGSVSLHKPVQEIPFIWLRELKCETTSQSAALSIWHYVNQCTQLKILNWKCHDSRENRPVWQLDVKHMPLASCRLEELTLDVDVPIRIDATFVHLVSELKRLTHCLGFGRSQNIAILDAAADTLEEVTIFGLINTYSPINYDMDGAVEILESKRAYSIFMKRLREIAVCDHDFVSLSITAPQTEYLCFNITSNAIDLTLLNSCRHHLNNETDDLIEGKK